MVLFGMLLKQAFPEAMLARGADDHFILIDEYRDDEQIIKKNENVNQAAKASAFGTTAGLYAGVCRVRPAVDASMAVDHARHALKEIGDDLNTVVRFYSYEKDNAHWMERYIVENLD